MAENIFCDEEGEGEGEGGEQDGSAENGKEEVGEEAKEEANGEIHWIPTENSKRINWHTLSAHIEPYFRLIPTILHSQVIVFTSQTPKGQSSTQAQTQGHLRTPQSDS